MPWHDFTFRATGFVSQSLFLCCAGMKVMALCPKIDRQGSPTFFCMHLTHALSIWKVFNCWLNYMNYPYLRLIRDMIIPHVHRAKNWKVLLTPCYLKYGFWISSVVSVPSSLEMQNLRPHPSPVGSEVTLTRSPGHLPIHSSLRSLVFTPFAPVLVGNLGPQRTSLCY